MSNSGNELYYGWPNDHLPEIGDMFDHFVEKAYRYYKTRLRNEPIYLVNPVGSNRRGAKYVVTCICYDESLKDEPYELSADCTVTVQNGVVVHVTVHNEWY